MKAEDLEAAPIDNLVYIDDYRTVPVNPVLALRELFELLETYCPHWYTEGARKLAISALRQWDVR